MIEVGRLSLVRGRSGTVIYSLDEFINMVVMCDRLQRKRRRPVINLERIISAHRLRYRTPRSEFAVAALFGETDGGSYGH